MKAFRNLKVRSKILIGYIIVLLLMAAIGLIAILRFDQISATVTNLANNLAAEQHLSDAITSQIWSTRFFAHQYINQQNSADLNRFNEEATRFDELLSQADAKITDSEREQILANIKAGVQEYADGSYEIASLIAERNTILQGTLDLQGSLADLKLDQLRESIFETDDAVASYYAGNAQRAYLRIRLNTFRYLSTGDEQWVSARRYQEVRDAFKLLKENLKDPDRIKLAEEAEAATEAYIQGLALIQEGYAHQRQIEAEKLNVVGPEVEEAGAQMSASVTTDFQKAHENTGTLVNQTRAVLLLTIGFAIMVGLGFGLVISYSITRPIISLTRVAKSISGGDLKQRVPITTNDEIGELGIAFNTMTAKLSDRTERLEILATLSGNLNAALEMEKLLAEVVNQVKDNFGYYHAHIYLLDESNQNLVVAEGTGQAGAEMKRAGHSIPLNAPTSLVAQAARTGEIVTVDNVREAENWLPNPLLPDTYSEMAVPIGQKGEVIGVLDVQQNKVGGLDEGDANLLRSLANQVAIALNNARLFEQTLQAKKEAELAKKDMEIANKTLETQVWQTAGQTQLNDVMQGEQGVSTLADSVIQQLCHYLEAQIGALYIVEGQNLNLVGRYAYSSKKPATHFEFGEGLVGQVALEKQPIIVTDVPNDGLIVRSGFSEAVPRNIIVFPVVYENRVVGVIELGTLAKFTPMQLKFIQTATANIAIAINTAQQGEELRMANKELESQTEILRSSEAQLKENQNALDRQNQELRAAQQELETKAEELARASTYKSEFLANMSHELRTPLNGILGYTQILSRDKKLSDQQLDGVNIIHQSGEHLLMLINDILDLAKIEAGKMELYPTEVYLPTFLDGIAHMVRMRAERKGIGFSYDVSPVLPSGVKVDDKRLRQVLINLLSNAIKFTDKGGVTFSVRLVTDAETSQPKQANGNMAQNAFDSRQSNATIRFEVSDTGVGISPAQLEKIFQPFEQVGEVHRRDEGTGLGLAISRRLAQSMGGDIFVTSQPDHGSNFWIDLTLPVITAKDQQEEDHSDQDIVGYQGPHRKILIVDDKRHNRLLLAGLLEPLGFEITEAADGKAAVELAQTVQPDLILMDMVMPVMTGIEATQAIRNMPNLKDIVIIASSASAFDKDKEISLVAGCDAFLVKPINLQKLLDLIQTYLKLQWVYSEPSVRPAHSPPTATTGDMVPPPAEELQTLYELARLGKMRNIREQAAHLAELSPQYIPFADRLQALAKRFEKKEIIALVEQYLE